MMYAVDSTFLEYKNILEFINSADCTLLFEPKDNIYYISFRNESDKLELQRLIIKIIN